MNPHGNILVVDDYVANATGLRDLLVAGGHAVRIAHNGHDALRIAAAEIPDLVLLDVVMPGLSGIDVCRTLKTDSATRLIPVIMVTASQDREHRLAAIEAGADDFLSKPIDVTELRTRVRSLLRVKRLIDDLESTETIMTMLGQIVEARDPYTEGHCHRLAAYARTFGTALGLTHTDLDTLARGATLHDIGKIGVPDAVLLKPGRLDQDERRLMQQHTVIGDNLCRTVKSLDCVRPIVRSHHERSDGLGYPDGLAGADIPLLAQVVGIVDVFDALTTNRPYRGALSVEAAYRIMLEDAARGWTPRELVETFIESHRDSDRTEVGLPGLPVPVV